MKPTLRVKITIIFFINPTFTYTEIFSSIQLSLTRTIGPSRDGRWKFQFWKLHNFHEIYETFKGHFWKFHWNIEVELFV